MRRKVKESYLNGEILFERYFSMGSAASITKLAGYAVSSGMTSVTYKNKSKLPRMGVWKAMWRWASLKENRDKAFDIFSQYVLEYGWTWTIDFHWDAGANVSPDDWRKFMKFIIKTAYQYPESRYIRFLQENGWS